jgi:hypothetical protein
MQLGLESELAAARTLMQMLMDMEMEMKSPRLS